MTPSQKLKQLIINDAVRAEAVNDMELPVIDASNVDELYEHLKENYLLCDSLAEIRGGQVKTELPSPDSRHYESREVAAQAADGSWIGWTYWYGGGKHGEPSAVPWIEDAYALSMTEEEVTQTVRRWKKEEADGTPD